MGMVEEVVVDFDDFVMVDRFGGLDSNCGVRSWDRCEKSMGS